MVSRGLLIVVEGLDRSGKTSQCQLLQKRIKESGKPVKYMKFPDRSTATGNMINAYLQGQLHHDDHAIHLLFSANRWEAAQRLVDDLKEGFTVIVDRYSFSGAVYSAAKENPNLTLDWAWSPEIGLPQPDLVIFLDISSEAAAQRGGYGEERYEKEEMQSKVRQLFTKLFARLIGQNVEMLDAGGTVDQVAASVWVSYANALASGGIAETARELAALRPDE